MKEKYYLNVPSKEHRDLVFKAELYSNDAGEPSIKLSARANGVTIAESDWTRLK